MPEPELQVVTVSSVLEDTPEGMARMDRIRAAEERDRRALEESLTPDALARHDAMLAKFEADLLGLPTEGAE